MSEEARGDGEEYQGQEATPELVEHNQGLIQKLVRRVLGEKAKERPENAGLTPDELDAKVAAQTKALEDRITEKREPGKIIEPIEPSQGREGGFLDYLAANERRLLERRGLETALLDLNDRKDELDHVDAASLSSAIDEAAGKGEDFNFDKDNLPTKQEREDLARREQEIRAKLDDYRDLDRFAPVYDAYHAAEARCWELQDELAASPEDTEDRAGKQAELNEASAQREQCRDRLQEFYRDTLRGDLVPVSKEERAADEALEDALVNPDGSYRLRVNDQHQLERVDTDFDDLGPSVALVRRDNRDEVLVPDDRNAVAIREDDLVVRDDRNQVVVRNKEHDVTVRPKEHDLVPRPDGGPLTVIPPSGPTEVVPITPIAPGPKPVPKPEPHPNVPGHPEKVVIADVTEVAKRMAWTVAENRLNEILTMGNRERGRVGWLKSFVRARLASMGEEGYKRKFYDEALREITNNQDLMADIQTRLLGGRSGYETRGSADKREQWEILDSVVRQIEEQVIDDEERGAEIVRGGAMFADLFNRHMRGDFADRAAFEVAAREAIEGAIARGEINRDLFTNDASRRGDAEGLMYASNLWQIAERYRADAAAKIPGFESMTPEQKAKALDGVAAIGNLDIRLANKLSDINESRPERPDRRRGYLAFIDRMSNSVHSNPILGALVNPTTLGLGTSILTRTATRGLMVAGAAVLGISTGFVLPVAIGALSGGIFAYINRHRNLVYDRGLEQRREALGQQGEGRRAEVVRQYGFSDMSRSATELLDAINSGDRNAAVEAAALLEAEREMRRGGRPVDLVTATRKEGDQMRTNLVSKTELRIAVRNAGIPDDEIQTRVDAIRQRIAEQDGRFERFRNSESFKAGVKVAAVGAVLGIAAVEARDWLQERALGRENSSVTLLEYLRGQRAETAHFHLPGTETDLPAGSQFASAVRMTNGESVPVQYTLGTDGKWTLDPSSLPKGYDYDKVRGLIVHVDRGVPGGELNQGTWAQFRERMLERFGGRFRDTYGRWAGFADEGTHSVGDSYTVHTSEVVGPTYFPHSNRTELMMDFHQGRDGSVIVDLRRMLGERAFGSGRSMRITSETLDQLGIAIGPRARELSHDILIGQCRNGQLEVPKELADQVFQEVNGRILTRPGFMVTANGLLSQVNESGYKGGATRLYELAAAFHEGHADLPGVPPQTFTGIPGMPPTPVPVPPGEYIPPIWFSPDRRRPIGDVVPGTEDKDGKGPDDKDKKGGGGSIKDGVPVPPVVPPAFPSYPKTDKGGDPDAGKWNYQIPKKPGDEWLTKKPEPDPGSALVVAPKDGAVARIEQPGESAVDLPQYPGIVPNPYEHRVALRTDQQSTYDGGQRVEQRSDRQPEDVPQLYDFRIDDKWESFAQQENFSFLLRQISGLVRDMDTKGIDMVHIRDRFKQIVDTFVRRNNGDLGVASDPELADQLEKIRYVQNGHLVERQVDDLKPEEMGILANYLRALLAKGGPVHDRLTNREHNRAARAATDSDETLGRVA